MNTSGKIDHDAVLRARTMLLGSGGLGLSQEVWAYRVLVTVGPATYLPKLARALVSYGYRAGDRDLEGRLALHAEAVGVARRVDAAAPGRTEVLCAALDAYQHTLLLAGRRAEALAVCEEMAEAGRLGSERGGVTGFVGGQGRLPAVLAEEGRHAEAADVLGRRAAARGPRADFWDLVEWAAELAAAGRHGEALAAFTALVDGTRREAPAEGPPPAALVWELVHRSRMFDASGHHEEAGADRLEALLALSRLREAVEPGSRGNVLDWWVTLFALSGRAAEPVGTREAPVPPFGADRRHWSPDTRTPYLAGIPALEATVTELTGAGRPAEAWAAHRRLARRVVMRQDGHHWRFEEELRPLFDEDVALARRLTGPPGTPAGDSAGAPDAPTGALARGARTSGSPEALADALTDRAMFLVAAQRYQDAHADFAEAVGLLDGAARRDGTARTPIVTRT
ncbi:hypothetical protein [Streptomyces sp. Qhu_M48]|uniref:hypothetical protein n=1 Tax=Streptomyces sp. Qhu_M48 TaxID=3435889 RepID=UPI003F4F496A